MIRAKTLSFGFKSRFEDSALGTLFRRAEGRQRGAWER